MRTITLLTFILCAFNGYMTKAQVATFAKERKDLQQHFLSDNFIGPQLRKGAVRVRTVEQMDSLFAKMQDAWDHFVHDSLLRRQLDLPTGILKNLDAYSYFWGFYSLTQALSPENTPSTAVKKHLFSQYMLPSVARDVAYLKNAENEQHIYLLWRGALDNTLALGTQLPLDTGTLSSFFVLYTDVEGLLSPSGLEDAEVQQFAQKALEDSRLFHDDLYAKKSLIDGDLEKASSYWMTGLALNRYPKSLAVKMGKELLRQHALAGDKEKSYVLLRHLALNVHRDVLPGDSLRALYLAIDTVEGEARFRQMEARLAGVSFQRDKKQKIKLPAQWTFLNHILTTKETADAAYLLLDIWHTACGPCLAEIPALNDFYEEIKGNKKVIFLSVNVDQSETGRGEEDVKAIMQRNGIIFPAVYDNTLSNLKAQLNIDSFPCKVILDKEGYVMAKSDHSPFTLNTFREFANEN